MQFPSLTPMLFLILMLILTAGAGASRRLYLQQQRKVLRDVARKWQMHFVPGDRLRLAARVAENFPLPGVCDVHVRDLMYRTDGNLHQYLFTIEYATGVISCKNRMRRVGGFTEPVTRGAAVEHECRLILAAPALCLTEQYHELFTALTSDGAAA